MSIQTLQLLQFFVAAGIATLAIYIGSNLSKGRTDRRSTPPLLKEKPIAPPLPLIAPIETALPHEQSVAAEAVMTKRMHPEPPLELPGMLVIGTPYAAASMIETHHLRKVFVSKKKGKSTPVEAVKGITFSVARGEIFGLLGPNGAGKTTTMRMLSTLLLPTSGTALIDGKDLTANQESIRRTLGYVSQVGGMQRESTGRENLLLQAKLYGMSTAEATVRVAELLQLLELESFADRKTSTYSGGQRRIFDLASGIVHRPSLLFLDEPSTGLDPQNRVHVWEQVKKMHAEGTTIVVTTHYLEEADALCDRVAIVDEGTIVAIGSPEELKRQIAEDIITLEFALPALADQAAEVLAGNTFITEAQRTDSTLALHVDKGNENLPTIIALLHERQIESTSIALSRPTLDDVFLKMTGHRMREQ